MRAPGSARSPPTIRWRACARSAATSPRGKYRDADAERYGYALALARTRQYDAARAEIQKLIERRPELPAYRLAEAEIETAAGRYDAALSLYAAARRKFPGYTPLLRTHAEVLLKAGPGARGARPAAAGAQAPAGRSRAVSPAGAGGGRRRRARRGAPGAGGGAVSERQPGRGHRAAADRRAPGAR